MRFDSFVPTSTQKDVIRSIINASTPRLAALTISVGQNQIAARDTLIKYGIIEYSPTGASLTAAGQKIADDFNLKQEELPITAGYLQPGQLLREFINM